MLYHHSCWYITFWGYANGIFFCTLHKDHLHKKSIFYLYMIIESQHIMQKTSFYIQLVILLLITYIGPGWILINCWFVLNANVAADIFILVRDTAKDKLKYNTWAAVINQTKHFSSNDNLQSVCEMFIKLSIAWYD